MKILAFTFGDMTCASTFYRVGQYLQKLRRDGIQCDLVYGSARNIPPAKLLSEYDVVLVQKKLFPVHIVNYLRSHAKRLIFDIDDSTWHPQGRRHSFFSRWRASRRLKCIVKVSDACLAPNMYIIDHLKCLGGHVHHVPMAISHLDWTPKQKANCSKVRLGWSGAPLNLHYLETLEPILFDIITQYTQAEIVILCGEPPSFKSKLPHTHIKWTPGCEANVVPDFDIGLLPLPFDRFSNGKSPIKALQYLAAGLPIIASPLAGTVEIAKKAPSILLAKSPEEWKHHLSVLISSSSVILEAGKLSRTHFEENYSAEVVYPLWKSVLISG